MDLESSNGINGIDMDFPDFHHPKPSTAMAPAKYLGVSGLNFQSVSARGVLNMPVNPETCALVSLPGSASVSNCKLP